MDPTIATSVPTATEGVRYLNIEYFFFLIYQATQGGSGSVGGVPTLFSVSGLITLATAVWIILTIVAYLLSAAAIALLVYSSIRMYQVEDEERIRYAAYKSPEEAAEETEHHRWAHVRELIESASPNDWRQAIIESDIILEDMLTRLGYRGGSIGEKLKTASPEHFRTLDDAWEAHKVRNEIAHQGSAFPLTDHIAYRTILQYENVFKEHDEI